LSTIRRKASSFEEYWLASKAWERHGLTAAAAGSLVHNGFLTVDALQGAHALELATIPGIGRKSLAALRWAVAIGFRRHLAVTTEPSGPEIRHLPRSAACAPCWRSRPSDCNCPTAETRDTVITLARSSACSCYCDTSPRFEQKRVGRAREGNIGGSSGTGGPSGVIAQTDLPTGRPIPWKARG
jgi:hypothetical protein